MRSAEQPAGLTAQRLAGCIDHTVLAPDHTVADVDRACADAVRFGFAAVSVSAYDIERAVRHLAGSSVAPGGTVGIPFGHGGVRSKEIEAGVSVDAGAREIDMVLNLVAARSGRWAHVRDEIAAVRRVADGLVLKVILETCYLMDEAKRRACLLAVEAGADFVKTSTGFGPGGATVADVRLMKEAVGDAARVKAAGGIRTVDQVRAMLAAGAERIGTSAGVAIMDEFLARAKVP
jgi:deoxyribose-phosphate aldolase